jgi:hypothetical protein
VAGAAGGRAALAGRLRAGHVLVRSELTGATGGRDGGVADTKQEVARSTAIGACLALGLRPPCILERACSAVAANTVGARGAIAPHKLAGGAGGKARAARRGVGALNGLEERSIAGQADGNRCRGVAAGLGVGSSVTGACGQTSFTGRAGAGNVLKRPWCAVPANAIVGGITRGRQKRANGAGLRARLAACAIAGSILIARGAVEASAVTRQRALGRHKGAPGTGRQARLAACAIVDRVLETRGTSRADTSRGGSAVAGEERTHATASIVDLAAIISYRNSEREIAQQK